MSLTRKVRIVNETGNPAHTEILDAETNERFTYITSVDMHLTRDENQVRLTMALTPFDIVVDGIIDNEEDVRAEIVSHEKRIKELKIMLGE